MSFVELGNGTVIQPSPTTYSSIALAGNVTLVWPFEYAGTNFITPMYLNVTGVASTGYVITLPDANKVSVGSSIVFQNTGANTFSVVDADGGSVITVPAGTSVFVIVSDNTSEAGEWQSNNLGAGSSVAKAAPLAGLGLTAITTTLNVNSPVSTFSVPMVITASMRGSVQVWTGGSDTQPLPAANGAGIGNGYMITLCNITSAGILTITGTINNGLSSINLLPTETIQFISNGTQWYSFGNVPTQTTPPAINVNNVDLTGLSTYSLTLSEASYIIQNFTGTIVGTCQVIVPDFATLYFVNNLAAGGDITFKDADSSGYTMVNQDRFIFTQSGTAGSLRIYPFEVSP